MSHVIFRKPPAMGTHVKIFYKSKQRAEPLLLLTFIGDGHTTGFTIPNCTFDANDITIIVNDNILPSTDWIVSDSMWRHNWVAEEKSTIQLNKEQKIYQLYSAPFVLSMNDHAQPMKSLTERLSAALKAQNREYMGINFEDKKVYYVKSEV